MKKKLEKDSLERVDELVSEIVNEDEIKDLKDSMDWSSTVAKLYINNPEYLINQAKVRGHYFKALRKHGFSKKTAEKMVWAHFDNDYFESTVEQQDYED